MASKEDALEAEAKKEGAKEVKDADTRKKLKLSEKLKAKWERTAKRAAEAPNSLQLGIAGAVSIPAAMGGFKTNRKLREYTADWLNEEGERSAGAVFVADVLPPLVGGVSAGVGLGVIRNGAAASVLVGAGAGFAAGSLISTVLVG